MGRKLTKRWMAQLDTINQVQDNLMFQRNQLLDDLLDDHVGKAVTIVHDDFLVDGVLKEGEGVFEVVLTDTYKYLFTLPDIIEVHFSNTRKNVLVFEVSKLTTEERGAK